MVIIPLLSGCATEKLFGVPIITFDEQAEVEELDLEAQLVVGPQRMVVTITDSLILVPVERRHFGRQLAEGAPSDVPAPEPAPATAAETAPGAAPADPAAPPAPAASNDKSEVLRRMMERREKEMNK